VESQSDHILLTLIAILHFCVLYNSSSCQKRLCTNKHVISSSRCQVPRVKLKISFSSIFDLDSRKQLSSMLERRKQLFPGTWVKMI